MGFPGEIGELGTDAGIGDGFDEGGVDLVDDWPGRGLGGPDAVPDGHVEARHAGFVDGGNVEGR